VRVFVFPLLRPIERGNPSGMKMPPADQPLNSASFLPFGKEYCGRVSLVVGWLDRWAATFRRRRAE
jgi:hypothetical protein